MFTRCPNCDTTFRVTPTQLKMRAGTVRCGQCHFVFNALDTLADIPADFAEGIHTTAELEQNSVEREEEVLTDWGPLEETHGVPERHEEEPQPADAQDNAMIELEALSEIKEPFVAIDATVTDDAPYSEEATPEPYRPAQDYLAAPILHEQTSLTPRWPWIFGSGLAVLLLVVQLTYYYRVELAAMRPDWRPALTSFCSSLNCNVPRPRYIDAISIESSDLRPDPQQVGRLALSATLRSKSPFAQEWPLLELTLTDVADRKLAVRHFGATDYLPKAANRNTLLAGGFPSNGEIPVMLALDIGNLQAAGYRLYVFYP